MIIEHEFLPFNTASGYFELSVDEPSLTRFLKGVYRGNKPRFNDKFIEYYKSYLKAYELEEYCGFIDNMNIIWDSVEPYTYKEAFELENPTFRSLVFSSINITEMIENLGAKRIAVEGKELINKVWNEFTNKFDEVPYTAIYELYHVNGEEIGVRNGVKLPIVKCWCTTTSEEHWMWVSDESASNNSPLEAIASCCIIYESMVGKIKHIIRQGDVFIFEMIEDVYPSENEETVSIPMDEYFRLLKSQA